MSGSEDSEEIGKLAKLGDDPLGLRTNAETLREAVREGLDLLRSMCAPAAEEIGLFLRDKVQGWRAENAAKVLAKTRRILEEQARCDTARVHPRVLDLVLREGSWQEEDELQELWAGLLAASCDEQGRDQANVLYAELLRGLTPGQVRALKFGVENCAMSVSPTGVLQVYGGDTYFTPASTALDAVKFRSIDQFDAEMDDLRRRELLGMGGGLNFEGDEASLTPTPLGVRLYVRCQGTKKTPAEFFALGSESKTVGPQGGG